MALFLNIGWANLFLLVILWLLVVAMALWMVDLLFPRVKRNRSDHRKWDA